MKVCILPQASKFETTIGGVTRVVSDLTRLLPEYGVEVIDDPDIADIIHCHALSAHPQVNVYTNHGVWDDPTDERFISANEIIYRLLVSADVVTSVSEHTTHLYKDRLNIKPRVIRNGVDIAAMQKIAANKKNTVPYFLWAKNNAVYPNDPRPVLWLAQQMPNIQFAITVVPDGYPIPANVKVLGIQPYDRMLEIIANCGALIATTMEQFSVQVIEALAMGKPVLGFDWGGTSEVITSGFNGVLAKPPNSTDTTWPQLLSAAIELLSHGEALSKNAVESSRGYDLGIIIPQYLKCYNDALRPSLCHLKTSSGMPTKKHKNDDALNDVEVSIVVTCYNLKQYVEEAIQSAIEQNFAHPYEIIIVDDCSTDGSQALLKSLRKKYPELRLILNKENMRAGPSRNKGIEAAHGRYIVCLDGDDKIDPNFLNTLYSVITKDKSIGIAYCNFKAFGTRSNIINSISWDFNKLVRGNYIPCCNMFRKVAWERCGGYKNINPSWEDYELWLNMGEHGYRGKHIPEALFHYRMKEFGRNAESQGQEKRLRAIVNACHPMLYTSPVGVVIPCYGHKKYLPDAIRSLQGQTFQDFRCVVVEDGGDQRLSEVMPTDDYRFSLLVLDTNGGLPAARNRGIEQLNTEYILPLDADDELPAPTLERLLTTQNSTLQSLIVYGDMIAFWDNGDEHAATLEDYHFEKLLKRSIIPATAMYPRRSWANVGGYDESMIKGYEDWDFYIRLGIIGTCGYKLPLATLRYRQNKNTMRAILSSNIEMSKSIIDYIVSKYSALYNSPERPAGCCGESKFIRQTGTQSTGILSIPLYYTGNKSAALVVFVNGHRYLYSTKYNMVLAEIEDVEVLLETGMFSKEPPIINA